MNTHPGTKGQGKYESQGITVGKIHVGKKYKMELVAAEASGDIRTLAVVEGDERVFGCVNVKHLDISVTQLRIYFHVTNVH